MAHKFRKCCFIKMLPEPSMHPNQVKVNKHFNLTSIFVLQQIKSLNIDPCLYSFDWHSFGFINYFCLQISTCPRLANKVRFRQSALRSDFHFCFHLSGQNAFICILSIETMPPKKLPRYSRPKKTFMFFFSMNSNVESTKINHKNCQQQHQHQH